MLDGLKPYPAYKESGVPWLGKVPEHWEIAPTASAFRESISPSSTDDGRPILSLSYGQVIVKPLERLHGLVPRSFESYQAISPGDIIVRTTDLQNDRSSLRVGFSRNIGKITSAYLSLRTRPCVSPEFGYRLLSAYDLLKILYGYGSGLRQNLTFGDVKRMPALIPPSAEQSAIVQVLEIIDRRVRRYSGVRRRLIRLLEEQKSTASHRMVTCGVDRNVRTKDSGIDWYGRIPATWQVVSLGRVLRSAIDGPHYSPAYVDDGVPFLSARNIKVDRWSLGDAKLISEADFKEFSRRVVPERGDVLYTKGGTTGVARVVDLDFPFQVWVHVAVLKVEKSRILPPYLALVLNSPRCYEQSQLLTRGATNQDLGLNRMKQILLPLPPLRDQEAILRHAREVLEPIAVAVEVARREISLATELRTRLIADVVTGKFDVREIAALLPLEAETADSSVVYEDGETEEPDGPLSDDSTAEADA